MKFNLGVPDRGLVAFLLAPARALPMAAAMASSRSRDAC